MIDNSKSCRWIPIKFIDGWNVWLATAD